ncbi:hypothetical protein BDV27DRAFT_158515 [Aspergillus caelatus]|uniref:AA1-like domain-containing protein n=1 Tax=Aspergillus caelatus TaxID=61420 RepID=A0A5N7A3I1_9EURO|nr:uncharacterized protein BDV27DRAFT_158515 [Aspergillus caelatus]KAE8363736.1 hypothetical protein BDV27DRAFT_158515 [Aspergillus caelatus]
MKLTSITATVLLGAPAALAAPQSNDIGYSTEDVTVTDVKINISADNMVTDVSLKLSSSDAKNLTCSTKSPQLSIQSDASTRCGNSRYLFNLVDTGLSSFDIAVMHEYDVQGSGEYSPGQWGQGHLNLNCKSNSSGHICASSGPSSLFLTGQ